MTHDDIPNWGQTHDDVTRHSDGPGSEYVPPHMQENNAREPTDPSATKESPPAEEMTIAFGSGPTLAKAMSSFVSEQVEDVMRPKTPDDVAWLSKRGKSEDDNFQRTIDEVNQKIVDLNVFRKIKRGQLERERDGLISERNRHLDVAKGFAKIHDPLLREAAARDMSTETGQTPKV